MSNNEKSKIFLKEFYYELNVCDPPPKYIQILNPEVMVLVGEAFKR